MLGNGIVLGLSRQFTCSAQEEEGQQLMAGAAEWRWRESE